MMINYIVNNKDWLSIVGTFASSFTAIIVLIISTYQTREIQKENKSLTQKIQDQANINSIKPVLDIEIESDDLVAYFKYNDINTINISGIKIGDRKSDFDDLLKIINCSENQAKNINLILKFDENEIIKRLKDIDNKIRDENIKIEKLGDQYWTTISLEEENSIIFKHTIISGIRTLDKKESKYIDLSEIDITVYNLFEFIVHSYLIDNVMDNLDYSPVIIRRHLLNFYLELTYDDIGFLKTIGKNQKEIKNSYSNKYKISIYMTKHYLEDDKFKIEHEIIDL
ncbi:hypothetical protein [Metaclostridioides mangenotii]|uniref:hypothetical protein n=1 Tax=Metaclostridioides mangenotii TaxID=1540 RepID=UPI000488034E|nr:hypothetical protein [Clostridioides mangenotii]